MEEEENTALYPNKTHCEHASLPLQPLLINILYLCICVFVHLCICVFGIWNLCKRYLVKESLDSWQHSGD